MKKLFLCLVLFVLLLSCKKQESKNITVFASSSLRRALKEICHNYESDTGVAIECIFNSSGKLREQIEAGTYPDIYFSSSRREINTLKNEELLYNDTITNILGNKIVLIAPKNSDIKIKSFADLTNKSIKKIAIGESMTSPIGRYAEELLKHLGMYKYIADKIILGNDAKHIIELVKMDKIDCCLVYETEAKLNDDSVTIVAKDLDYSKIIYSLAIIEKSQKEEESKKFIDYLFSDKSMNIFKEYGFDINI